MKKYGKALNWIGGIWLLVNIPIIPFIGSALYLLNPIVYLLVSVVVTFTFIILSKSLNKPSVIASLCVIAIAILHLKQVTNYLQSMEVESLSFVLLLVIGIAIIAVCTIIYKLLKKYNA